MKKLSRRELFRGAGAAAVGGAVLAVGLKPESKPVWGVWTPEFHLPRNVKSLEELRAKILRLSLKRAVQLIESDGTVSAIIRLKRNNSAGTD